MPGARRPAMHSWVWRRRFSGVLGPRVISIAPLQSKNSNCGTFPMHAVHILCTILCRVSHVLPTLKHSGLPLCLHMQAQSQPLLHPDCPLQHCYANDVFDRSLSRLNRGCCCRRARPRHRPYRRLVHRTSSREQFTKSSRKTLE